MSREWYPMGNGDLLNAEAELSRLLKQQPTETKLVLIVLLEQGNAYLDAILINGFRVEDYRAFNSLSDLMRERPPSLARICFERKLESL